MTYASASAPGGENEDFAVAAGDVAVIVGGAPPEPGVPTGCSHGVPWFARTLGLTLATTLVSSPMALGRALGFSIQQVRDQHADTCDLDNPSSPSATVALLRRGEVDVEYLVLGDCAVVLHTQDDRGLVTQGDGSWAAGTRPEAARQALKGTISRGELRAAALLTDGACRLATDFGMDWLDLLKLLDASGPHDLIERTRAAERDWADRGPDIQRHDVTAVLCRFPRAGGPDPARESHG